MIAVISDTHLREPRALPQPCARLLGEAELILHAGDISTAAVLEDLGRIGPRVQAVHGNVDEPALLSALPEAIELDVGDVTVAMTHDAGRAQGRLERMRARFPHAAAVVFGHSHMPLLERAPDGFQIFNPGSPTARRRAPAHTIGLAHVEGAEIRFEHVVL